MIAAVLVICVGAAMLGCVGLWRLPTASDRLHLVSFVTVTGGLPLLIAALLTEGATARVCKIAAMVAINLLAGAAGSHAMARAFHHRGDA